MQPALSSSFARCGEESSDATAARARSQRRTKHELRVWPQAELEAEHLRFDLVAELGMWFPHYYRVCRLAGESECQPSAPMTACILRPP